MQLHFADAALQHIAESVVRSEAHFGSQDGALVRQRLSELLAAGNLAIARSVPSLNLKPVGSHPGKFGVRLRARLRLVFEVTDLPLGNDVELELARIETIRILGLEECDES
jgi:hypothetical protein